MGYYGYQPTYGGYHQNSYGGYGGGYPKESYGGYGGGYSEDSYGGGLPEDSYGGYGGYQKDSYGGYGGNQIGSYGGYGGGYQKQSYGGYGGGYQTGSYGYGNSYGYKKHYGTKYDPNHVEATVKKVGEYAGAQEKYKKQSLNVNTVTMPSQPNTITSKNTDGEAQLLSALCTPDTDMDTIIRSNTDTVIMIHTDTGQSLTVTRSPMVMVKSPTVTNPNTEKNQ